MGSGLGSELRSSDGELTKKLVPSLGDLVYWGCGSDSLSFACRAKFQIRDTESRRWQTNQELQLAGLGVSVAQREMAGDRAFF